MMNIGTLKITTRGEREIIVTRLFNAPRQFVWDAMTKPELLRQWLSGPPGWAMVACDNDLTVGGTFRCAWTGPDRASMTMHGVYREIVTLERIVRTETFDHGCKAQSGEQIGTLTLNDHGGGDNGDDNDGKTSLTLTILYPSKEARDATIASGMERGMAAGYDGLDELLASAFANPNARSAA